MDNNSKHQERTYKVDECCTFRKTKETFGGLSNMASGFPIRVNGIDILTSEALYQALRFPHLPEIQQKIIEQKSPMAAKMVSKPYRKESRPDWDKVRNDIMYWCLRVKLAQNFYSFGKLLASTEDKDIVENSAKDKYWGAVIDKKNESLLIGINALGRLLMLLRKKYYSENRLDLLKVEPLKIPDFILFYNPIKVVDERKNFLYDLAHKWGFSSKVIQKIPKEESMNQNAEISTKTETNLKKGLVDMSSENNEDKITDENKQNNDKEVGNSQGRLFPE